MKEKLKRYVKKLLKVFTRKELRVLPGNIAFFSVLALIPIITIIIWIASYFSISIDSVVSNIENIFPPAVSDIVVKFISGRGFDSSLGTFTIFAFFIASNGTYAIISSSNTLYNVEKSDAVKDRIKSVILLIILITLIVFLLLVPMFGNKIINLISDSYIAKELLTILRFLKWPITFLIIYCNLKLIYTIVTTVIWTIATAIFSYYLQYFARYDIIYGNLSSLIILMIWIYLLAYVFVFGMAINTINMKK